MRQPGRGCGCDTSEGQYSYVDADVSAKRSYWNLFFISFVLLFLELACIRWFGSTVVFLTFFTNIVLLATFLGMSVGCLAASSSRNWAGVTTPLLLLAAMLACGTLWAHERFGRIMIDVGGQGSPQEVFFGTEYRARNVGTFVVPIELLAGVFFVLIALSFVGLGQIMGRAFNAVPDRLRAYTSNIAGSLAGIAAFGLASYWRTSPVVWFAVAMLIWLYFMKSPGLLQIYSVMALLLLISFVSFNQTTWSPFRISTTSRILMWSPYYKIEYLPQDRLIVTNNISHQQMVPVTESGPGYSLSHLLARDSGLQPFEDVLIIGAGSGNDVAAALAHGVKHVDAVEIDPTIYNIGRLEHPNRPYDDPRVTIHIDDGRSFVRRLPKSTT